LFARNREGLEAVIYGNWLGKLVYLVKHALNRNSRKGSRRNIHAHYDIGNSFYQLWLDPSMTYSSALFAGHEQSLQQAQQAKYARLLQEALPESDAPAHLLEIGCGWGGFAELAARAGHQVHGITLSTEQLAYARQRMDQAGLAERARLSLTDYRDTQGQYDAVVSVEMFEAVGQTYWPSYFRTVAQRLKPGGRAAIQTITIADPLFDAYRRSTDFIQQYIFPGGMLPSPSAFAREAQRAGLRVVNTLSFGLDYARTLALWRKAFHQALPEVRAQGFDERFIRTWDFYLAYCEAGFASQNTDVLQITLVKD
jgi:cyclopropane-fatty-acyl-phospholipid synthase